MKRTFLIISLAVLAGCQTDAPASSKLMSKQTRACAFFETGNLLYTQGLGEAGVPGLTKRIEGYLAKTLCQRGITIARSGAFNTGDAKLTVNLNTIETFTVSDIGVFSPVVRQQVRIKYGATLLSSEGTELLNFEDGQDDQSLDNLTKKVAEKIASRVAKCYQ